MLIVSRHFDGMIQCFHKNDPAKEVADNIVILLVAAHQFRSDAHITLTAFQSTLLQGLSADGGDGKEGGSAAVTAFKELNTGFAVFFRGNDDILHGGAKGRLDSNGIVIVGTDQFRHQTVYIAQASAGFLHHKTHGLGRTFIITLHFLQHPASGLGRLQFDPQRVHFLLQHVTLFCS